MHTTLLTVEKSIVYNIHNTYNYRISSLTSRPTITSQPFFCRLLIEVDYYYNFFFILENVYFLSVRVAFVTIFYVMNALKLTKK